MSVEMFAFLVLHHEVKVQSEGVQKILPGKFLDTRNSSLCRVVFSAIVYLFCPHKHEDEAHSTRQACGPAFSKRGLGDGGGGEGVLVTCGSRCMNFFCSQHMTSISQISLRG